jgi:hypothetical protein
MISAQVVLRQRVAESQPAATAFRVVLAIAASGIFQLGHQTEILRTCAKPAFQFTTAVTVAGPAVNALIAAVVGPVWRPDFIRAMRRFLGLEGTKISLMITLIAFRICR